MSQPLASATQPEVLYRKRAYVGKSKEANGYVPAGSHLSITVSLTVQEFFSSCYDWRLKPIKRGLCVRFSGNAWSQQRKCLSVGQNRELFYGVALDNRKVEDILFHWSYWHGHDLRRGTEAQMSCLDRAPHSLTGLLQEQEYLLAQGLLLDGKYVSHTGALLDFKYGALPLYEPPSVVSLTKLVGLFDSLPGFNALE